MRLKFIVFLAAFISLSSCVEKKKPQTTPWGTPVKKSVKKDSIAVEDTFKLSDIQNNGELIMLTVSGPTTYYDYRGYKMGTQYLLCEKFAQAIGVSLRVEVCKDIADMVRRLKKGEGDVIAYPLPKNIKDIQYCASSWAVQKGNRELADTLNRWYKPDMAEKMKEEESVLLTSRNVIRHVYSPVLNKSQGVLSHYDHFFQEYASVARCDWRLLAAQCYQESTFDPHARSFAGACGLMQIMPSTAYELGLPEDKIWDPESNIAAAAKYIRQLDYHFRDIRNSAERRKFVLAAYNGGMWHVRDAMSLTEKFGGDPRRWNDVSEYVRKLATPEFFNDSVVKYGYMRGSETADYVSRIHSRWAQYRGVAKERGKGSAPARRKSGHKNKYRV